MDVSSIQSALETLLQRQSGKVGGVRNLHRLSGGASQETWCFDVLDEDGQVVPLILRRSPLSGPHNGEALGLKAEAGLLIEAKRASILVPNVECICDPEDGLGDAYIMQFIAGETLARKILRDAEFERARVVLAAQCGGQLARIHAMPLDPHQSVLKTSDGLDQLTRYEQIYRSFETARPVLELGFSWLRQTAPAPVETCLVHGDFRNGNLIVGAEGLRAVLDWELAHIGDPREDLGWLCVNSWRFGSVKKQVGGFGELSDLLEAYQANGGRQFSPSDIQWFQALGSLKWGIMCMIMYNASKTGADPSIERAMIGRRTSEAEIDLLNLMEGRAYA
jgi:aminoglycoside phosphotransferase (APT) family kinase protein